MSRTPTQTAAGVDGLPGDWGPAWVRRLGVRLAVMVATAAASPVALAIDPPASPPAPLADEAPGRAIPAPVPAAALAVPAAAVASDASAAGAPVPAAVSDAVDCEAVPAGTVVSTDAATGRVRFCVGAPLPPDPDALRAQWRAMAPAAVLAEAVARIGHGDTAGAIERLDVLMGQNLHPTTAAQVRFERGRAAELSHRCAEAVDFYGQVLQLPQVPAGVWVDAQFRRSLCLSDLGAHRPARRALKAAADAPGVTGIGAHKIAVEAGVQALRRGREKRGTVALDAALAALPADQAPWVRCRGLYTRMQVELDAAASIQFRGDERAAAALVRRAEHIAAAEQHVLAIVKLREPEYVLAALTAMGDAYAALQVDLLAAPPPRRLSDEQTRLYREAVVERGEVLRRKALKYWELGLQEGLNVQWAGPELDALRERLAPAG